MKILGFLIAVLFAFGVSMTSVHANSLNGSSSSAYQELDRNVLIEAKATPGEKETDTYQKKAQETINEYKAKMKELEVKAKNLNEKAKVEAREGMQELQKKMDVVEQKLKSIRSASGEAWEKLKAEVDSSLESVKETYKKIVARLG
jgi:ElaB/YqjD/DUF883 family membrane-anchored ribosome-binding protein